MRAVDGKLLQVMALQYRFIIDYTSYLWTTGKKVATGCMCNLPLTSSLSELSSPLVELVFNRGTFKSPALCVKRCIRICARIDMLGSGKGNPHPPTFKLWGWRRYEFHQITKFLLSSIRPSGGSTYSTPLKNYTPPLNPALCCHRCGPHCTTTGTVVDNWTTPWYVKLTT